MFSSSEEKLANQIMRSILAFAPSRRPQYLREQSLIFIPEESLDNQPAATINLGSFFSDWNSLSRTERTAYIDDIVEATLSAPMDSIDQRLASLRLRARTLEELHYRDQNPATATNLTHTLYGNGPLLLELVENSETHVKLVTSDVLDTLSINADEAFNMAAAAHRRETDANQWQSIGDVWMSNYQDDFDFSRLMITASESIFPFSDKDVIAYVPSHSVCVITNQTDAHTLEQLVSVGDQLSVDQRSFSKYLWTLNDSGEWSQYQLGIDAEAARVIKLQEIRENTLTYADQQGLLEKDDNSQDQHIASYVGFEIESGEIFSNTTYTLNQFSSLPKTDIVSIYDDEAEAIIGLLNWGDFSALVGENLQLEKFAHPARYSISARLSELQIDAIRTELSLAKAA